MRFQHRITTIYRKELIDILRDHRTLIAMIVVPIVLYPLLMLGSVQAVSFQAETLRVEAITMGVVGDEQRKMLSALIRMDAEILSRESTDDFGGDAQPSGPDAGGQKLLRPDADDPPGIARDKPASPARMLIDEKVAVFESREQLEQAIHARQVPIGVLLLDESGDLLKEFPTPGDAGFQRFAPDIAPDAEFLDVQILADFEEPRGMAASSRLRTFFDRLNQRQREARDYADPYRIQPVDMSSPASVLGAVLPLILILMTITGAIYPAIDLTAGERERGTLESLMACPVPVIDLIVGKFLVVTTVAVMGAALNLASVTATVYFGGFGELIAQEGGRLPIGTMVFILLALIPFAVFMSAIMMAVCSYARTFKEAQNYVTPVILAVLIPGGIAAFPATRLEGVMLVMPVGNMVALAKELLLGSTVSIWDTAIVLLSTCLYAGAAITAAAAIFGKESVVFADAGSYRGTFRRSQRRWEGSPSVTMGLLLVALLFPAWFFLQANLSPGPAGEAGFNRAMPGGDVRPLLHATAWLMPLLFIALPLGVMWFWKVNPTRGFSLRMPEARYLLAAVLIGVSAWAPAHEINVLQQKLLGTPAPVVESARLLTESIALMSPLLVILILAVVPAISEELLFRGFLLNALGFGGRNSQESGNGDGRKWAAIIASSVVFAVFHFFLFKLPVTFALGVILAFLCWQSRSIVPAILAHFLHNATGVLLVLRPQWFGWLGSGEKPESESWAHLPAPVVIAAMGLLLAGIVVASRAWNRMPVKATA